MQVRYIQENTLPWLDEESAVFLFVNFLKKCLTCVCKSDKVYICQRVVRRCATGLADDVGRCPSG